MIQSFRLNTNQPDCIVNIINELVRIHVASSQDKLYSIVLMEGAVVCGVERSSKDECSVIFSIESELRPVVLISVKLIFSD